MGGDIDTLILRVTALEKGKDANKAALDLAQAELDTFYLMWAGALIFLMQAGFATLSAGSIRAKNVKNILLKNLLDACIGAFGFFLLGYGFAYHADEDDSNPFIGAGPTNFALSGDRGHLNDDDDTRPGGKAQSPWISWYFQFAFAAAAATIVSGAVAERCQLMAYLVYSFGITSFVYPVVVHWVWDSYGFLSAFNKDHIMSGVIDFAGSGVVHMTGGFAALVGAKILGPRLGRFENPAAFEGHSTPLQIIGTFLLWFGWYGFNPGSTLGIHGYAGLMARSAVTTTLSAALGGLAGLAIKRLLPNKLGGTGVYDIGHTCNSLLGGLVGITAGCSVVPVWCAIVVGFIAAFVYHLASCTMRKFKIDDPLDAFAVHGACGVWGVLAVGLFAVHEYAVSGFGVDDAGLFMSGFKGELFGAQIIALLIEIPWVVTTSFILFSALKAAKILRVPADQEAAGLDVSKHGGSAYVSDDSVKA